MVFNQILGDHSAARVLLNEVIADLHIAIEAWKGMPTFAATELNITIEELLFKLFS